MGKLMDFFAKITFSGYILREHKITKNIENTAYATVAEEQQKLVDIGAKLPLAVQEVKDVIAADKNEISNRPVVAGRESFFDETGLTPAQHRAKQLDVLRKVNHYNGLIDREADKIGQLDGLKNSWEARLATKVVVKRAKITPASADAIVRELYDVSSADLQKALKDGGAINKVFTFNEAAIVVNCLKAHKIEAKAVELNAEQNVNAMSKGRDSEKDLRRVARNQRIFLSALFLLFFAIVVIFQAVFHNNDLVLIFSIVGAVGAALLFLLLWLLMKPILAVAYRVANKSFAKNAERLIERTGYLRGIVLSEEYEKGLDVLYTGLIDCLNAYNANNQTVTRYAASFLPERVYSGLLPMIIEQMSIGAAFNDALFKTEATIDRKIALKKEEERAARLEKEAIRHNAEMESQARRRADAEKQRAEAMRCAVEEQKRYNDAIRSHTRAVEENTREVRDLKRKIDQ